MGLKRGDKIAIIGDGVPSGEVVNIYWDDSTIAWNGVKGKLNDTTGDSDGTFEVWFKVPEATKNFHYVWVKSGTLNPISVKMEVIPKVSLSASSGLADKVDVTAYGLKGEKDVAVFFVDGEDISVGVGKLLPQRLSLCLATITMALLTLFPLSLVLSWFQFPLLLFRSTISSTTV
jgi:hypothetical protein